MAEISPLEDFTTHAAAFQKEHSRAGQSIEKQEAEVLGRVYGEMSKEDKAEARRMSRDDPEVAEVLQELDPRMGMRGL
jgi:hypothetical protein